MGAGEMPAETFYDQVGPFDVRISWGQGDCVQVATRHKDGYEAAIAIVNGWLVAAGENPIDAKWLKTTLAEKTGDSPGFSGWHATFTSGQRRDINGMIVALQKARDQAFGKDA